MPDLMPQPKRNTRTQKVLLRGSTIIVRLLWIVGCAALFAVLFLVIVWPNINGV